MNLTEINQFMVNFGVKPGLETVSKVVLASRMGVIFEHRSGAYLRYVSTGAQKIALRRSQGRLLKQSLTELTTEANMAISRRRTLLTSATFAGVLPFKATAQALTTGAVPDEKTIADAYIYLLGRVLVIRQEHMDAAKDGFSYNEIRYNPLGSADFVNPNFDVAYL
jgi:hypothetical protein